MSDQMAILNNGQQHNIFFQELISHAAVSLYAPPSLERDTREYPDKMQIVLLHIVMI